MLIFFVIRAEKETLKKSSSSSEDIYGNMDKKVYSQRDLKITCFRSKLCELLPKTKVQSDLKKNNRNFVRNVKKKKKKKKKRFFIEITKKIILLWPKK